MLAVDAASHWHDEASFLASQDFEALLRTGNDEVLSVFQPRLKQPA